MILGPISDKPRLASKRLLGIVDVTKGLLQVVSSEALQYLQYHKGDMEAEIRNQIPEIDPVVSEYASVGQGVGAILRYTSLIPPITYRDISTTHRPSTVLTQIQMPKHPSMKLPRPSPLYLSPHQATNLTKTLPAFVIL